MNATHVSPRRYGGRTAEERHAERKAALTASAIDLWQEHGWSGVTMRGVCSAAGLTDRYFYESFSDRDALLGAIWDQMRDEVFVALFQIVEQNPDGAPLDLLGSAIDTLFHDMSEAPARIQILFGDHAGSEVLEQRRHDAIQLVTDAIVTLAQPYLREGVDRTSLQMTTLLGIGGFVELVQAWRKGIIEVDASAVARHAKEISATLGSTFLK